jgi:hypothetical protein
MKRRSSAGGKSAKPRVLKRSAPKHHNAPKATGDRGVSVVGQKAVVARLTRERDEALEQQNAAEVLKIISASPTELQPVLDVVVRSAARFCDAHDVTIFELDGQDLRFAAHWGTVSTLEAGHRFPCIRGHVRGARFSSADLCM